MGNILLVARKEFRGYFATPAAYLFIGAFLATTLFVFFWVEAFFARNIADVRPLFQWMPVLLIFLVAALTMRAWAEERRTGTLESLLSAPVPPHALVLGKCLAALSLVTVALTLTLPLPITVSLLGPLDWGPVIGGYVAAMFLSAAYVSIGLYVSSRTDNAVVALIMTALIGTIFYLIGSDTLTALVGHQTSDIMALLGTGSRFESITRGVLDLRDLYYYLSIVGIFLALNLLHLERLRWAGNPATRHHKLYQGATLLACLNLLLANFWLAPVNNTRLDMTAGGIYTLSETTRQQLTSLREPLLIRGYFSARTHPLLAPLVPQIRDLLQEYAVAAGDEARIEFIDPTRDKTAEEEAAARFGIRPIPFQTASRYQAEVVSSWFDIVIAYGDQYETLGFRDLIEVKTQGEGDLDVVLKNPEYAITRAIRKVTSSWQAGGSAFETMEAPVTFQGFMSADDRLPDVLQELKAGLVTLLDEFSAQSQGRFSYEFKDPDADNGALAETLASEYGFGPQVASLFDPQPFWFYMVMQSGGDSIQVPLPETMDKASLRRALEAGVQRLAPGFLKTVAVYVPPATRPSAKRYERLMDTLSENHRVTETDLASGQVPSDADMLLVLAPEALADKPRFAIDQFLMRGGSVVLVSSPFDADIGQTLSLRKNASGLEDWLAHHGIQVEKQLVLDPRNAALPVPMERQLGGMTIREVRMLPYPHFPDIRGKGLNPDHPATSSLQQLTLHWPSPVTVDEDTLVERQMTTLLESSPGSWTTSSLAAIPDYRQWPDTGFAPGTARAPHALGVLLEGRFTSWFQGQESPVLAGDTGDGSEDDADDANVRIGGVIEHSPESARLVVIASNAFASDGAIELASQGLGTLDTQSLAFVQNLVDWALEDPALLGLRGRTQLARTLSPQPDDAWARWEYLNYGLALLGLLLVWGWRQLVSMADRKRYARVLAEV